MNILYYSIYFANISYITHICIYSICLCQQCSNYQGGVGVQWISPRYLSSCLALQQLYHTCVIPPLKSWIGIKNMSTTPPSGFLLIIALSARYTSCIPSLNIINFYSVYKIGCLWTSKPIMLSLQICLTVGLITNIGCVRHPSPSLYPCWSTYSTESIVCVFELNI